MHKIEVQFSQNLARFAVSLFTREWIEITGVSFLGLPLSVSLFTREWIEIQTKKSRKIFAASPSLRGSGLKSVCTNLHIKGHGLPLYEGVD